MSEISDFVRRTFGESDTKRDAGLTTPHDVERFDDIVYGDDPKWQILDVYRPREASGKKLPVIVSIHGGGWVYFLLPLRMRIWSLAGSSITQKNMDLMWKIFLESGILRERISWDFMLLSAPILHMLQSMILRYRKNLP